MDTRGNCAVLNVSRPKTLLMCEAQLWGKKIEFVIDSGAALEGVISSELVPSEVNIRRQAARLMKVGDGRMVWTEVYVDMSFTLGSCFIPAVLTVLKKTGFQALLGIHFLRRPESKPCISNHQS